MIAKDLINYLIPPLHPTDKVQKAKQWMEELRTSELPVIEGTHYQGLITEEILFQQNLAHDLVKDYELEGTEAIINQNQHYYELLKLSNQEEVSLIAVLDDDKNYLGVVAIEDVVEAFANTSSVRSPGAILVLSLNAVDYSLSEVSRLIESNEAKILSSYVIPDQEDPNKVKLTLKINREEVNHIIATLERFGYIIEARFNENSTGLSEKDRIDSLLRYLNF